MHRVWGISPIFNYSVYSIHVPFLLFQEKERQKQTRKCIKEKMRRQDIISPLVKNVIAQSLQKVVPANTYIICEIFHSSGYLNYLTAEQ